MAASPPLFPGGVPRSVRGRPSGLQAARASPAATALRAGLDPGDLGGPWAAGIKGQAGGLPLPAHGTLPAPAAYGEHGKRHLPALLQRPVEPKDVDVASMSYPRSRSGRRSQATRQLVRELDARSLAKVLAIRCRQRIRRTLPG